MKQLSHVRINVAIGDDIDKMIKEAKEKYELKEGIVVKDSHIIRLALVIGLRSMLQV